jgi:hypothetical protein
LKILLINQAFYPDVVSTAQHASDLCRYLTEAGHEVEVIASRRAYDDPQKVFAREEVWHGIHIRRISSLGLGKKSKTTRALDFLSFLVNCTLALLRTPRTDIVIAMTSPPLVAFLASLFSPWKRARLVYWVMDLNPDEAIAAGWLDERSAVARVLQWMSLQTFRRAAKTIVLDRFMEARVLAKGVDPATVEIIPPWSHDLELRYDPEGREAFRRAHGLEGRFVVMHSGNHSPCHPLDTLLEAARRLANRPEIAFCFVGGGSEFARVRQFAAAHGLENVRCLPYQPLDRLSASLSAADLHAVAMGNAFVGVVHPCKIYNILMLGIPVLYIGPKEGHIPDLASPQARCEWFRGIGHGEAGALIDHILAASSQRSGAAAEEQRIAAGFSAESLLGKFLLILEKLGRPLKKIAGDDIVRSNKAASTPGGDAGVV